MKVLINIILVGAVLAFLPGLAAADGEITVGERSFTSLSEAVSYASDGDTVWVDGGEHTDTPLLIEQQIALIGLNNPVIDAQHQGEVIRVKANNVLIEGFTITGSESSHIRDNAAIRFDRVTDGIVRNNILDDNFFGIYLARAHRTQVLDNKLTAYGTREATSANGIHAWYTNDILIRGNTIKGHRDGIYLEYVEDSEIIRNEAEGNIRYGLHFMFSNDCVYNGNTFRNNGAGTAVMYSENVDMHYNLFLDNWGSSSYGMLLKDMRDSRITHNQFIRNTAAIRIDGSSRMEVENNRFRENGWAIRILANSPDNHFTKNDFINNAFDVATNSRRAYSTFDKNYWSHYSGYDLDGDGYGDVPYRPVRLFSLIVEQNATALILLRSIFIDLLDIAERVVPVLTPETLIDENPLMKEVNR